MSPRIMAAFVGFCLMAGMFALMACPPIHSSHTSAAVVPSSSSFWGGAKIQSKAAVFDLPDQNGSTKVGIMAAYDPESRALWWRPTALIAEPGMLERYFERCQFVRNGKRVLNFCVRGNEVVVTSSDDYAQSLDQGIENAESRLRSQPGLLMSYHVPGDSSFSLQQKAGVDMNTPVGVPPTVVRSVKKIEPGWQLDVTCGCGNALITVNENFDFIAFKHN